MRNAGSALMGIGYGSGESRAVDAARQAIDSPLLELSIAGAKGLLFNITGGTDLSMFEVDEAAKIITESVDQDANIIFGATINEDYTGEIKITVVATGFDESSNKKFHESKGGAVGDAFRSTPFGKRAVNDSRITPSLAGKPMQQSGPNMQQSSNQSNDDLDIPTFLRKAKK